MTAKEKLIQDLVDEAKSLIVWAESLEANRDDTRWTPAWVKSVIEDEQNWNAVLVALRDYQEALQKEGE